MQLVDFSRLEICQLACRLELSEQAGKKAAIKPAAAAAATNLCQPMPNTVFEPLPETLTRPNNHFPQVDLLLQTDCPAAADLGRLQQSGNPLATDQLKALPPFKLNSSHQTYLMAQTHLQAGPMLLFYASGTMA